MYLLYSALLAAGLVGQPALLDFRKAAPWQVPRRPGRAAGQSSAASANALHACNLGARGFSRRGVGNQRVGARSCAGASRNIESWSRPQPPLARSWQRSILERTTFSTFPLDFAFAIRPYLSVLRPRLVLLAETEFWPNFLRLAHASGARVAVVNARISDRSRPGYRRFRFILKRVLRNIDLFLAQTSEDASRLRDIGAPADRVQVSGNLKFDVSAPDPPPIVASLRTNFQQAGAGPVVVCGSTVEGEEAAAVARLSRPCWPAILGL